MTVIPHQRPEGVHLFKNTRIDTVIHHRSGLVSADIEKIPPEEVLRGNLDDLADDLAARYQIRVPDLHENEITVSEPTEAKVDVSQDGRRIIRDRSQPFYISGTSVTFIVPFTGSQEVFGYEASTSYVGNAPIATVKASALEFTYTLPSPDPEQLRQWFAQELELIKKALGWALEDLRPFNESLAVSILKQLSDRRDRLRQNADLAADLGYPLKRRDDAPTTYAVPAKRRRITVRRPAPATGIKAAKLDPALLDDAYEDIIDVLKGVAQVMEYSPRAFRAMGEEDLRWVFLIPLNIAFEGEASGETFNYEGKTDMLIRAEGQNVFIAECLIWNGPAYLTEKVDQLLGYTAWRDTKTTLIVFNRNKSFTQVLEKIAPTIEDHPNYLRSVPVDDEGVFRFVLSHRDDPDRELFLTVLCFDVPSGDSQRRTE